MLKKSIICVTMVGVVVLAFASKGGGDKGKKDTLITKNFTPIRTTNGFTLRSGPAYTGSLNLVNHPSSSQNGITYNTVVTYERGNTTIIVPYKYTVSNPQMEFKSNLRLLDLKINLHN